MKKLTLITIFSVLVSFSGFAQGTGPAYLNLREFFTQANYGTARTQAMGGAFTALGGDMSSAYINPAGLGFYNRSEYSIDFNLNSSNTNARYIENPVQTKTSSLDLGQMGVVFSLPNGGSRLKAASVGISYNTLANFANTYDFSGVNNSSSIADGFAELANEANRSPQSIENDYNNNGYANYEYEMAYMAYLIDYFGDHYEPLELSLPVRQEGNVKKSGAMGQINLSYGANFDDKTYVGVNIGIPTLNYAVDTKYDEYFNNQPTENSRVYYENNLRISGVGVNATIGLIQRLNNSFNIGVTATSPTLMKLKDSFEQYAGSQEVATSEWVDTQTGVDQLRYKIVSPFKASLGISAFLPQKFGVFSAEAEFVGYNSMNIKDIDGGVGNQTSLIKNEYQNVVNLKAGLELRKGIGRLRAGVNLVNDPFKAPVDFNARKSYVIPSFGLGIRKANYFVDLSYSQSSNSSAYNPYTLANGDHYSVAVNQRKGVVGFTFGSFF